MLFFEFFLAIILLEIIANVCEKTAIFSKFDLWWPLVTSILTWPGNDLYKSWRSRRSLSNAVCRMSLRCVVFEISGGGGAESPPPRTELALTLLVAGSWLPLLVAGGGGCLGPPLISPVLTGRFLKFKRHSFRLNMIYISKKSNFKNS